MDSNYLDFGSDDSESGDDDGKMDCMDSDEEERLENEALLKLMTAMPHGKTKKDREITDFEAEMEAELDRRAFIIENQGGVEHQKKTLSRSSSNSSLTKVSVSPVPGPSGAPKRGSNLKGSGRQDAPTGASPSKKSVRFTPEVKLTVPIPGTAAVAGSSTVAAAEGTDTTEPKKEFYDQIYFDSDESEGDDEDTKKTRRQKRSLLSNDDLLYDPESDAKDQAWVDKRRRKYYTSTNPNCPNTSSTSSSTTNNPSVAKPLPNSDAVLNCPACFSTLCLDCQRHEFYTGQYRAMFVMNCVINREDTLRVPLKTKGKGKKQVPADPTPVFQSDSTDVFNPVKCKICNTQVAVFDIDEVYHFFNVLASHS